MVYEMLSLPNSEREKRTFRFSDISANNPFLSGSTALPTNPFAAQQRPSPTLNEMINNRAVQSHPGSVVLGAQPSTGMQPMMGMASVMGGIQPVGLQPQPTACVSIRCSEVIVACIVAAANQSVLTLDTFLMLSEFCG
uniref:Protein kinase domain-containing protein n=1 Tax=Ascaris lumbricoides TaxID=6252 RepID=A0A0M3IJ12_ASCLU